jgi:hypothetical protein
MHTLGSISVLGFAATLAIVTSAYPSIVQSQSARGSSTNAAASRVVPDRGKKLILKDGSFQIAREYQRHGDRVRYFSAERGDWEELPAALIDWDATAKAEAAAVKEDETLLKTVHHQEEQHNAEMPMDVDASLPVAPGIYLPAGEGMFVVEGKSVTLMDQAGAAIRTDKKQFLKQVLSPIPIVPNKKNIEIAGAKSVRRINSERPEFYLREVLTDADQDSTVRRSSRPNETGPEIELVRLTVKGSKRQIESIQSLVGQQISEDRNSVTIQRWDVAKNLYRFTLSKELPAGEYALAEILPDGVNLYVWDFGVDRKGSATVQEK